MRFASRFLAVLAIFSGHALTTASAEDAAERQAAIKKSVESAIGWLQDRGETWKDSRQCTSCHHVSYMTWAMQEAKRHAIEVDEELLKTTNEWLFAEGDTAKLFTRPSFEEEDYSNPVSMVSLTAILTESNNPNEAAHRAAIAKVFQNIADSQQADGSWKPFFGRKPLSAPREALALWLTNLTNLPNQPEELRAIMAEPRRKAKEWLKTHHDDTESHVEALRLWMLADEGTDAEAIASQIERLIKQQRDDGGWTQSPTRDSDAYATSHVLYAFQQAKVDPNNESFRRGVDFLLKTQTKDGSWLMISRENPPVLIFAVSAVTKKQVKIGEEPPAVAATRNIEPISFVATAWSSVVLSRMLP